MNTVQVIEILKKITINSHITRSLIEDGKFIYAHRKNDAVIDQLSLLMSKLADSLITPVPTIEPVSVDATY